MSDLIVFAEAQYQAALIQLNAAKNLLESIRTNAIAKNTESVSSLQWVYIDRLSEISGLSRSAIRNRISRGTWRKAYITGMSDQTQKNHALFSI